MGQRVTRRQVGEGLDLYAEKNYDAAIKKWTIALQKMKDNRLRFSTLGYLASASRDRGRNKDYLVYAVQQIDIAHELDDNNLRAQAYLTLSRANEMLADYFKAVSYSRSALQHSSSLDSVQGYALLVMADSYIGLCNFPKVLECLDKALSISHENEDHLMEVQVLSTMGKVFLALKDFPKALAFQRRAHELALSNATYAGEQLANISSKFVRLTKLKLATPLRLMGDFDGATKCVEVHYIKKKNSLFLCHFKKYF
jgi:tetratricopeptide (TPR) repeat protein